MNTPNRNQNACATRQAPKRRKITAKRPSFLPVWVALALVACLTVGGTLAFLQEDANKVTNTFEQGEIEYSLTLEPNAPVSHEDEEVSMPAAFDPKKVAALSADFEPSKTPELTGYVFSGWYYDEGCTERYADFSGNTITVRYGDSHDENAAPNKVAITLYAKWTPIEYTIAYDKNKGSGSSDVTGSTASSTHTYDVAKNLTANGYSRAGYTFAGWNAKADGTGTSYADKQSVKNLTATNGATVYLYAQWTPNDVKYVVNHWQQNIDAPTAQNSTNYTCVETENKTAKADSTVEPPVKTYAGFTSPSVQTVTVKADGSTVVNYYYTRNSYTVTLQKDTGVASVSGAGTYHYGESVTINATLSNGYKWVNWTGTHSATAQEYTFTMPANNVTDKANADPIVYKITYTLNGGSVSGNPTSYTVETATFTLKNPTKTGYTFTGWTGTGLSAATKSVTVAKGSTGDRTYTANWKVNSYTVTLKAGTGIASVSGGGSKNYCSNVSINATLKTGYKWVNWTGYSTTTTKNHSFTMPAHDVTYTANGAPIEYKIKYHANGGSGTMSDTAAKYDQSVNLRANGFTRTGYAFAGWATSANGNVVYGNQASVKNLSSTDGATVNLYAKWTPITYKVVYHSNDIASGDSKTITDTVTYDSAYSIRGASTFSFGNNLLAGWSTFASCNVDSNGNWNRNDIPIPGGRVSEYLNKSCGQSVSNLTSANGGTIHLYAIWTPKTVEVWAGPSSTYPYGQGLFDQNYAPYEYDNGMSSPSGYLWQEHPSSKTDGLQGLNNIRKDDLHAYPVGYNSVYRYATPGVIMDINYMRYFRFDIRMSSGTIDQLKSMGSGQIEFSSSGVCDNQEMSVLWSTVWANSYYYNHTNETGSWMSVYVPLNLFSGSANKSAINFIGVYWAGGADIGLKAFMCDPRFEYDLPSGAQKFDLAKSSEAESVDFTFDISVDELGAFANSDPVAGEDFEMTFTPAEGYEMPENVIAVIDGTEYLYPSADLPKGTDVDGNECYVLTIPGELLTAGGSLHIQAIAEQEGDSDDGWSAWGLLRDAGDDGEENA